MAFVKKTWTDRLSEFAGRRLLTRISGSADTQMVVDVTRAEGNVSRAGDAFSAANMNDLEQRIGDGIDGVENKLGGLSFYEDKDGNKYVVGADTVPKKLGSNEFNGVVMRYYKKNSDSSAYLNINNAPATGFYNYGAEFDSDTRKTTIKYPGRYSMMISDYNGYAAFYLNDSQVEVIGHSSKYFTYDLKEGDVLYFTGSQAGASAYIERISD